MYFNLHNHVGVQIGFEEVLYSVDESAGEVTLGVAILSGGLSSEVVVRLSTGDSSATGKRSPYRLTSGGTFEDHSTNIYSTNIISRYISFLQLQMTTHR